MDLNLEIDRLKLVLNFFESIEEFRDLSLIEWNFRNIVREKLTLKLNVQRVYWRQRGTIKWFKLEDVSTKLFHANATIRLRKILISQLVLDQDIVVTSHAEKEIAFWNSYKERIGKSEDKARIFDMENLIHPSVDLSILEEAFSVAEINDVVKMLTMDKSPCPDGFNNEFIKNCWPLIKDAFCGLCEAFSQGTVCLRSINTSFITLVPKKDGALTISDFRPISLLNFLTKTGHH